MLVVSVVLAGSAGVIDPVDGSGALGDVGASVGAVLVVSVLLVGSAGAVDPVDGPSAVGDVGAVLAVVSVVLVGSAGPVDPAEGLNAVGDVGALTAARTLLSACVAEDSGVCEGLGTGVAAGGRATVKTVAHELPAAHVSPFRAALVVSFAPSGAVAATVTRNEVVALDPEMPAAANAGTSQVTVFAR